MDNNYSEWRQQSGNQSIEDEHTRMLHRLRAILERTKSPNENEAATAATMLQRFLTEHNLSMADLEQKGAKAPEIGERGHDLGKAAFKWKLDLAEGIAEFYYCASLVDRKDKTVKFVGRPDNVEALQMLYGWVIDQVKAIATTARLEHFDRTGEHIDPLRWQVGFGEGAVQRLIERMREMKARQQEDLSRDEFGNVTAMILHHQSEVSDFLEEKYGYRTDGKKTKRKQKWDKEWEEYKDRLKREQEAKDELRIKCEAAGDMEPYYELYPDDRPDAIARREAASAKAMREYLRRERQNEKRRTGSYRPGPAVDYVKEEQSSRARRSGKENADKVNLQPFLPGNVDRKKVG